MAIKILNEDNIGFADIKLKEVGRQVNNLGRTVIRYDLGPYNVVVWYYADGDLGDVRVDTKYDDYPTIVSSRVLDDELPTIYINLSSVWLENMSEIEDYFYKLGIAKQCYQKLLRTGVVQEKK